MSRTTSHCWFGLWEKKIYSKDTHVNVSFSIIDAATQPPLFYPSFSPPFLPAFSFSLPLLGTLEKSRCESRLHQLRHNVTQDFEWAASSPLSSLASTGIMPYVLTFRDVECTQALTFALVQKREGSLSRGERGLVVDRETPYSWFSVIAKRQYRATVENRSRFHSETSVSSLMPLNPPGLYKFGGSRGHVVLAQVPRVFRILPPSGGRAPRNDGSRRQRRTN